MTSAGLDAESLPFVDELQRALEVDPGSASAIATTGAGDLPSAFRVTDLAVASIGVAAHAAVELCQTVGITDAAAPVTVDRGLASAWYGSAVRPIGWSTPGVWDPLARNYRARDGWIRLHTNAPHHRLAALGVLEVPGGLGAEADYYAASRAVSRWDVEELEAAVVEAGGCAAAMRSRDEWTRHPQGVAVAAEALVEWGDGERGGHGGSWHPSVERPLAGLRVLDLTRVIAGPVATRFLAGLGADVLRVDPPGWDEDALVPNMTLGKRATRLDARTAEGAARLEALLADADVLVHGYRDGALAGLGLDAAARQRIRPGLVDVSLDAYGFAGPWAARRGFDSLVQMSVGIAAEGMRWARAEQPTPLPVQALDHSAGYLLAAAAIRGVSRREATGRGCAARTSLARVAETLVAAGELPVDGPLVERPAPTLPLTTPWGDARMLAPPMSAGGIRFSFHRPPRDLGADVPEWL